MAKIRINSDRAKEMRVFLLFLVWNNETPLNAYMFMGILMTKEKWSMFYCNGVIVMVCVDGITITALQ